MSRVCCASSHEEIVMQPSHFENVIIHNETVLAAAESFPVAIRGTAHGISAATGKVCSLRKWFVNAAADREMRRAVAVLLQRRCTMTAHHDVETQIGCVRNIGGQHFSHSLVQLRWVACQVLDHVARGSGRRLHHLVLHR